MRVHNGGEYPAVTFANLKSLYSRRADRLRQLAVDNPLGDYLNFAAELAQAQQHALHDNPLELDLSEALAQGAASGKPPLDLSVFPRSEHWRKLLTSLIAELRPQAPEHILAVLDNLEKASAHELELMADALLNREFGKVGSEKAPFLWAALSLYWAQMASLIPGKARAEYGEQRQFCPVCGSIPVSSMVHIGTVNGLRYLHCNLCESEWHVVRVKCSNCEQTRDLNYWSLDSEQAAVKAESCGDCGTYLKILYQEKIRRSKRWPTIRLRWCWTPAWKKKASAAAASIRSCSRRVTARPRSRGAGPAISERASGIRPGELLRLGHNAPSERNHDVKHPGKIDRGRRAGDGAGGLRQQRRHQTGGTATGHQADRDAARATAAACAGRNPARAAGAERVVAEGKITFELPPGFSDQTLNSGIINDNTSTIQRFLDGKSRQSAVSSEVIPPDDMKLNTSDKMLKELAQSAIMVLAERYQNIQTIKEENFTVGKQKFRRVDTEQTVNGQKVVSTLVLTVFNKRVVTLQMLSPAKTPEVHQALVQRIIDTLAVK